MTTITIQVPSDRFLKLKEMADRLQITPEQLVRANVEDLLAQPEEAFQEALKHVLVKNAELYRRLATG
jgi:predicted transcriptional regulator